MPTNLEKWNKFDTSIKRREQNFIDSVVGDNPPKILYQVYPTGSILKCTVTSIEYGRYGRGYFFTGKSPSREDIAKIKAFYEKDETLIREDICFKYTADFIWKDGSVGKQSGTLMLYDKKRHNVLVTESLEEAEKKSIEVVELNKINKEFDELYKKDASFDYNKEGYKDLGWQNDWRYIWLDENGNVTDDYQKCKKSGGYSKDKYPEYNACREQDHRLIEFSHNNRGTRHDVSCPLCKIVWHYDSSD